MTSPPELRVAALTTGRQDYGILRSTIMQTRSGAPFSLEVWAGGMHLNPRFGAPLALFESDRLTPDVTLPFVGDPPDPSRDTARAVELVSAALRERRPDALLLVGDRSETIAAGVAATLAGVPIVHMHGGEETEGAIDNVFRHALTKLSHLHLVTHATYAERVVQMGEEPDSVIVVGAPGVDNLLRDDLPTRSDLERELGASIGDPVVVVTVHPATLGTAAADEVAAVAKALESVDATYVITQPNSDQDSESIRAFWVRWAANKERVLLVDALGERRYWGMLKIAAAVVGNSSSGIIEAPAAGVPVVNVGDRQRGRLRFGNVRDVPADVQLIRSALADAVADGRKRGSWRGDPTPVAPRIVEAIAHWLPRRNARKAFRNVEPRGDPLGAAAAVR